MFQKFVFLVQQQNHTFFKTKIMLMNKMAYKINQKSFKIQYRIKESLLIVIHDYLLQKKYKILIRQGQDLKRSKIKTLENIYVRMENQFLREKRLPSSMIDTNGKQIILKLQTQVKGEYICLSFGCSQEDMDIYENLSFQDVKIYTEQYIQEKSQEYLKIQFQQLSNKQKQIQKTLQSTYNNLNNNFQSQLQSKLIQKQKQFHKKIQNFDKQMRQIINKHIDELIVVNQMNAREFQFNLFQQKANLETMRSNIQLLNTRIERLGGQVERFRYQSQQKWQKNQEDLDDLKIKIQEGLKDNINSRCKCRNNRKILEILKLKQGNKNLIQQEYQQSDDKQISFISEDYDQFSNDEQNQKISENKAFQNQCNCTNYNSVQQQEQYENPQDQGQPQKSLSNEQLLKIMANIHTSKCHQKAQYFINLLYDWTYPLNMQFREVGEDRGQRKYQDQSFQLIEYEYNKGERGRQLNLNCLK